MKMEYQTLLSYLLGSPLKKGILQRRKNSIFSLLGARFMLEVPISKQKQTNKAKQMLLPKTAKEIYLMYKSLWHKTFKGRDQRDQKICVYFTLSLISRSRVGQWRVCHSDSELGGVGLYLSKILLWFWVFGVFLWYKDLFSRKVGGFLHTLIQKRKAGRGQRDLPTFLISDTRVPAVLWDSLSWTPSAFWKCLIYVPNTTSLYKTSGFFITAHKFSNKTPSLCISRQQVIAHLTGPKWTIRKIYSPS